MLGKLIKNEYRATARLILPLYIILIIVTILNKMVLFIQDDHPASMIAESNVFMAFAAIIMITYVLSLLAVGAMTIIFLIKRFYDSMLKDEGYLSFTLPVTTAQHLTSKIIVSYTWIVATILAVIASLHGILIGYGLKDFWINVGKVWTEIQNEGYQGTLIVLVLIIILSIYNVVITPYVCFSVGQLFNGHKIVGAFVTYIVIYIINQVIGVLALVAFFSTHAESIDTMSDGTIMNLTMNFECILLFVECAVFTFITHRMLDKKLNLD